MLQSKAGYIDARPHIRQLDEILLQRTAGPYIGSKPDIRRRLLNVRFAPESGLNLNIVTCPLSARTGHSRPLQRDRDSLSHITECHHDLRSDQNSDPCTNKQNDTDRDIDQVAGTTVRISLRAQVSRLNPAVPKKNSQRTWSDASPHKTAAVDQQNGTGHVGRFIRSKPQDGIGDLAGIRPTTQQASFCCLPIQILSSAAGRFGSPKVKRRKSEAGTHGVDSDAVLCFLERERLRQRDDARFRYIILSHSGTRIYRVSG
jgi:hypothetical protein